METSKLAEVHLLQIYLHYLHHDLRSVIPVRWRLQLDSPVRFRGTEHFRLALLVLHRILLLGLFQCHQALSIYAY